MTPAEARSAVLGLARLVKLLRLAHSAERAAAFAASAMRVRSKTLPRKMPRPDRSRGMGRRPGWSGPVLGEWSQGYEVDVQSLVKVG